MNLPDFDVAGWINTLDQMLLLDYDIALASHVAGTSPIGSKTTVGLQRQYLVDLTAAVDAALQNGDFMGAMNPELPQYSEWVGYDNWLAMNAATITLQKIMGY